VPFYGCSQELKAGESIFWGDESFVREMGEGFGQPFAKALSRE